MIDETTLNPCPCCNSVIAGIVPVPERGVRVMCFTCKASTDIVPITEGLRAACIVAQTKWNNKEVHKNESKDSIH